MAGYSTVLTEDSRAIQMEYEEEEALPSWQYLYWKSKKYRKKHQLCLCGDWERDRCLIIVCQTIKYIHFAVSQERKELREERDPGARSQGCS